MTKTKGVTSTFLGLVPFLFVAFFFFSSFLVPAQVRGAIIIDGKGTVKSESNVGKEGNMSPRIVFTEAEEQFMRKHPVIRLGVDPTFVPYEFFDADGKYKGIAADYLELIAARTGLVFSVEENLTWTEAYAKATEKELDLLPCVSMSEKRANDFLFSTPYYTFQRAIFIKENNQKINNLIDLLDVPIAVQSASSHHSYLLSAANYKLNLYSTVEEAIQKVSNGQETAFIGNLATTSYLIKTQGITNLKYVIINDNQPHGLHFAVRNDWPILVEIINKALYTIDEENKIVIQNKWIGIEKKVDYTGIIRITAIVIMLIVIIISVSVFWIVQLRKEIRMRQKTQEELEKAKEEAERANQTKSLFLARMSHEIRTPLNAIMGMAYLVKKTNLSITQGIYLDKITEAAQDMLGIINNILDFSKVEAGKIQIEKIPFDFDQVIKRVIDIIAVKVEGKDIELLVYKEADLPVSFFGDPVRLEQILLNILNNAIKFTERGTVSLSIKVSSRRGNLYLIEIAIKDTGIGMSSEQVKGLFTPFQQGDPSINRRYGGTGLGLSIVKNLVELLGGHIWVESEVGQGSTFTIRLPLEAEISQESLVNKALEINCFSRVRALILDNCPNDRKQLADWLNAFGINTHTAATEEEVKVPLLQGTEEQAPYDLLLIDYLTPQGGGIEFLREIKKSSSRLKETKFILIVPLSREDIFEEMTEVGYDYGLSKPVVPSTLYNALIELCQTVPLEVRGIPQESHVIKVNYPYHILLVEDNKVNQIIARSILEQAGFTVTVADNGEYGYTYVLNHKDVDLILMDIHMPVMDGYTAVDLIRQIDQQIPIVAMTADAIAGVEEKCKSHGMNYYVSKPFDPHEFIKTILGALKDLSPKEVAASTGDDEEFEVLDIVAGIKRVGGDAKLYQAVLESYYEETKQVPVELQDMIKHRDYVQARQIVHKVKGSSGNIGAHILHETASTLQKALDEHDEALIIKSLGPFLRILTRLLRELEDQAIRKGKLE